MIVTDTHSFRQELIVFTFEIQKIYFALLEREVKALLIVADLALYDSALVLRTILHQLCDGGRWRKMPKEWGRWNTLHRSILKKFCHIGSVFFIKKSN